jgi:hypothetical protein
MAFTLSAPRASAPPGRAAGHSARRAGAHALASPKVLFGVPLARRARRRPAGRTAPRRG